MQIMIDTATDAPTELYRIGKYLVDTYATTPATTQTLDTSELDAALGCDAGAAIKDAPLPPPVFAPVAAPPPPVPGNIADDDAEVEVDAPAFAVSVSLPAAVPPPPGPAVAPELDSRGLPWDGRIHAANRSRKIDGSWKTRRGADPALIAQIEGGTPAPLASTAVAPITSVASVPAAAAVSLPPVVAPIAPVAPPPPPVTAGVAAPAAVAPSAIDFRGLMQKIQAASAAGKLTTDQVNGALAGVGLKPEEMAQLINNAPLIASVNAAIDSCLSA